MNLGREFARTLRAIRRAPASVWLTTMVLGIVIGVTTATYSFLDAVLLEPFPYPRAESLVMAWGARSLEVRPGLDRLLVERWRRESRTVQRAGMFQLTPARFEIGTNATYVNGTWVDAEALSTLGVPPAVGRAFSGVASQDADAVVLSHGLWQGMLGGNPRVVGTTIQIDGRLRRIVGVMPQGFFFPDFDTALWVPLDQDAAAAQVHVVARLRPGVSIEAARAELRAQLVAVNNARAPGMFPLTQLVIRDYDVVLWTLLGAGALLLLAACANTSNVLLARRLATRREMAVRIALGASTMQVNVLLLLEPVVVAAMAGLTALLVAQAALLVIQWQGLTDVPRLDGATIDWRAIGFGASLALVAAVATAAGPLLSRRTLIDGIALHAAQAGVVAHPAARLRSVLLMVQIALVVTLLAGAGLLASSFVIRSRSTWGFAPDSLVLAEVRLPPSVTAPQAVSDYVVAMEDRIRRVPGVRAVTTSNGVPVKWTSWGRVGLSVDGMLRTDIAPAEWTISPGYARTMGIAVLEGREFTEDDGAHRRVVVGRSLARRLWPQSSAIGRQVSVVRMKRNARGRVERPSPDTVVSVTALEPDGAPWEVIGVVDDVRMFGLDETAPLSLYTHVRHLTIRDDVRSNAPRLLARVGIVVDVSDTLPATVPRIRAALRSLDSPPAVEAMGSLAETVSRSVGGRGSSRLMWLVSLVVIVVSLVVACAGTFGMTSYTVSSRLREFGIRRSLGAGGQQLAVAVCRDVGVWGAVGLLTGLSGALAVGSSLKPFLFGVSEWDPRLLVATGAVVVLSAVAGSIPAIIRAARLDPSALLREQ